MVRSKERGNTGNKMKHCANFDNGQTCTCETIVWAMQNDACDYAEKSAKYGRCLYQRENERCDNPDVCAELKGKKGE